LLAATPFNRRKELALNNRFQHETLMHDMASVGYTP
jgi:hypothetical protein